MKRPIKLLLALLLETVSTMRFRTKRSIKLLLALLLAAASALTAFVAAAQQVVDVSEGDVALVQISVKDLTRIRVANSRIENIRGNDGELVVDADKAHGEIYVRPVNPMRPVNLFVTSETGNTYTLLLTPKDVPGSTVVLRERGAKAASAPAAGGADYQKNLEKLTLAMARSDMPRSVEVREKGTRVRLWKGTTYTLEREYWTDQYVGEIYSLSNSGDDPIVMTEGEFFRDGVVAISVENMTLDKNESTNVYIVRKRMPNE